MVSIPAIPPQQLQRMPHLGAFSIMTNRSLAQNLCRWITALCCVSFLSSLNYAQTLSERLIQEDATQLAEQARKQGNIVRGAILFHQGSLNCIKCHRSNQGQQPIAPELSRLDAETTDASIVESILLPSKVIRKGYESIQVLTTSGSVIVGLPLEQTPQGVVLRGALNPDERITIPAAEIEQQKPSDVSSMPSALADQLKDRQQFLDLVRYVLDIRDRGTGEMAIGGEVIAQRELNPELKGLTLIRNKNCIACHKAQPDQLPFATINAPDLNWSAKRLRPKYIEQYILAPHSTKPGSSMPDLLPSLAPEKRREAATSIAAFLVSRAGSEYLVSGENMDVGASQRGEEIFHTIGCVACHASRDEKAKEEALADSVPMGNLSPKYDTPALVEFLENPHAARPRGRMPNMQLSHREALDLAAYLLQSTEPFESPVAADSVIDDAKKGEQYFLDLGCASCHDNIVSPEKPVNRFQKTADWSTISKSNYKRGCLSEAAGPWPQFNLTPEERTLLQAACSAGGKPLDAQQTIDWTLTTFLCTNCHSRDGLGGVPIHRNHFFQTTNLNLGDQGRIPPTLTGSGAKLKEKWMREVLLTGRVIRPYMKTRMPQFGEANIGYLIGLLQANDHLPMMDFPKFDHREALRKQGLEIVGNQGLNCVACHTYQYKISDTMPAVDLTEMAERLKKDWFHQYMLAPQKFSPNTVMPSFWPGGKAIRPDIQGDAATQIEAIWEYLLDGRQANSPRGVIREPLEIVIRDEARMLRRSYEGIGKRGIGVGYPGDVNIAFDAEQMRLGMIWRGKFVDPAGVWYGQGHGNVRTLGRPIPFARGPELDDANAPWSVDDGRPPKHKFLGYQLDAKRRPTFFYEFDGIRTNDFFSENEINPEGPKQLRRNVVLSSPMARTNLRFRLGSGSMTKLTDNSYRLENGVEIRVQSPITPIITGEGAARLLSMPIDLDAGQPLQFSIDYVWE